MKRSRARSHIPHTLPAAQRRANREAAAKMHAKIRAFHLANDPNTDVVFADLEAGLTALEARRYRSVSAGDDYGTR